MHVVVGAEVTDGHAAGVRRPQRLFPPVRVLRHHRGGGFEDGAGRAVVLLQLDDLGVGIVTLEVEDVAHVGAAEAIDALVVVAHHAQVAVLRGQQVEQVILRHVGVLVLVHHDVAQAVLVALADGVMAAQHLDGEHQQVVEIEGGVVVQARLINPVHAGHRGVEAVVVRAALERLGIDEVVLQRADAAPNLLRGVQVVGDFQVADDLFDQRQLIGGVVDDEIGRQAEVLGFAAQQARAGGMEGAEPQRQAGGAEQAVHPLAHFLGRLVGERDGQNLVGAHAAVADEVGDAMGDDARFARPGAGQNQYGTFSVLHRFPLRRVELGLPGGCHEASPPRRWRRRVSRWARSAGVLTPSMSSGSVVRWAMGSPSAAASPTTSVKYCSP